MVTSNRMSVFNSGGGHSYPYSPNEGGLGVGHHTEGSIHITGQGQNLFYM